jgi:hypothetical protein
MSSAFGQDALDAIELDVKVDPATPIEADKLLALWSDRLQIPIVRDPQMAGTIIRLRDGKLSWGTFKQMLDFVDVVIEKRTIATANIFFAHLRRNIPARLGPPFPVVSVDELASRGDEIVTTVMNVKNGAGNDIFATVRGLLVRDVNRIGNILYVRGPETIIIVDFAYNCSYYAKIIQSLDVPGAGMNTRVFDLQHANVEDTLVALYPVAEGVKLTGSPRTNQLIASGSATDVGRIASLVEKIDVATGTQRPRFHQDPGVALWKLATAFAAIAFVGQTVLLRRYQKRLLAKALSH